MVFLSLQELLERALSTLVSPPHAVLRFVLRGVLLIGLCSCSSFSTSAQRPAQRNGPAQKETIEQSLLTVLGQLCLRHGRTPILYGPAESGEDKGDKVIVLVARDELRVMAIRLLPGVRVGGEEVIKYLNSAGIELGDDEILRIVRNAIHDSGFCHFRVRETKLSQIVRTLHALQLIVPTAAERRDLASPLFDPIRGAKCVPPADYSDLVKVCNGLDAALRESGNDHWRIGISVAETVPPARPVQGGKEDVPE